MGASARRLSSNFTCTGNGHRWDNSEPIGTRRPQSPSGSDAMARTRVKICGITRLADAQAAVALGADALGFVFFEESPRWIHPARAREIIARLPPFVTPVGLFVNAALPQVCAVVEETGVACVQFHGQESPETCAACPRPYIKAIPARPGIDFDAEYARYAGAQALLVDTWHPRLAGGTGEVFEWSMLGSARRFPLVLAGGLTAGNVAAAIMQVRPYAVDVSGGVESAKGIKDAERIREFITEVAKVERKT